MSQWVVVVSMIGLLAGSLLEAHALQTADPAAPGKPPAAAPAAPGAPGPKAPAEPRPGADTSGAASASARLDQLEKDLKAYQERALLMQANERLGTIQSRLDKIGEGVNAVFGCLYVLGVISIVAVATLIVAGGLQRRRWREAVGEFTKAAQAMADRRATPVVLGVDPPAGPVTGRTRVKIRGRNFVPGATVHFGGAPASGTVVLSPDVIEATTPSGTVAGLSAVTVHHPDGAVATNAVAFTYEDPPTIRQVTPQAGPSGTTIAILGKGFRQGTRAEVDGVLGVPVFGSENDLTHTMPTGTVGKLVKIAVVNPDGQRADWGGQFTYQ